MLKTEKIWHGDPAAVDSFADFRGRFRISGRKNVCLKLSCDGGFSFTVNGLLAGFGECTDFPEHREHYTFDITPFCAAENEIVITVWHYGADTQTYINAPAFLAFCVEADGQTVLSSDKDIESRQNPYFRNGYRKQITTQLGFSYLYDCTAEETPFGKSDTYGTLLAADRTIAPLKFGKLKNCCLKLTENSVLSDLGEETVGFLNLEMDSPVSQKILVAYGEHLRDGHVAREIDGRDFSMEVILRKGKNVILIPHRRLAGRYLEIFAEDLPVENIHYAGILSTLYPIRRKKRRFADPLDQKIYDVSVHTLHSCMHEHYEDCPWREQALYTMDSRNQMLCGYEAFYGHAFQRHSLELIAKSLRPDGILSICAPSGLDLPIPSFSLMYFVQVAEYIEKTGDSEILGKIGETLKTVMSTFTKKIGINGLIPVFSAPCWNFYEWSDGNDHCGEMVFDRADDPGASVRYDLILNCLYVHAAAHYDKIFGTVTDTGKMKCAIRQNFFDEKRGLFRSSVGMDDYSVLGNSLALLIGLGEKELAEKLIAGDEMTPITLSMTTFLYDSLLKTDQNYRDYVLADIRKKYKKMLDVGATSFWETELGAEDFHGAGSLCHGWSAMPIYYFNRLNVK